MPGVGFLINSAKRLADSRALYAQLVITDDCNLSCSYCTEFVPGAMPIPLPVLKKRVDRLDELGVMIYDLLGGEPLLHPGLLDLVGHIKSKRRGGNIAIVITNGFLLTPDIVAGLNRAGLDMMQISVDSIIPTVSSPKSLKTVLPKLRLLAREARFSVKVQSVLTEQTVEQYDEFRRLLSDLPFDFSFSLLHHKGGRVAIRGERYAKLLKEHDLFAAMRLWSRHAEEMLLGDDSRPWKCLGGYKFLYLSSDGTVQYCSQNRGTGKKITEITLSDLRQANRHKECEPGCAIGCARLVSHALGEPLNSVRTGLGLLSRMNRRKAGTGRLM